MTRGWPAYPMNSDDEISALREEEREHERLIDDLYAEWDAETEARDNPTRPADTELGPPPSAEERALYVRWDEEDRRAQRAWYSEMWPPHGFKK